MITKTVQTDDTLSFLIGIALIVFFILCYAFNVSVYLTALGVFATLVIMSYGPFKAQNFSELPDYKAKRIPGLVATLRISAISGALVSALALALISKDTPEVVHTLVQIFIGAMALAATIPFVVLGFFYHILDIKKLEVKTNNQHYEKSLTAIRIALRFRFGLEGLKLYPKIARISDYRKLQALEELIEVAQNVNDIKAFLEKEKQEQN